MSKPVAIFGFGGHGRVLLDALIKLNKKISVIIDKNYQENSVLKNIKVYSNEEEFFDQADYHDYDCVIGVGKIPGSNIRETIWNKLADKSITPINIIHPKAILAEHYAIGSGVQILASSVIQQNSSIGDNVIINTGSIIEHDVRINDDTHVAPGSILLGGVSVGASVFIGSGTIVREGVRIGDNATIGMGSLIFNDVPDETKVLGRW